MSKVLLLGGAGLIGTYLARSLADDGHEVFVLDNLHEVPTMNEAVRDIQHRRISTLQRVAKLYRADVRYSGQVAKVVADVNPDVVGFLAALLASESSKSPQDAVSVQVDGLGNTLKVLLEFDSWRRFMFISSSYVYGDFLADVVDENQPRNPIDVYGRTKLIGEELTQIWCRAARREFVIVRPAAVYGYGDSRGRLVDFMIRRALAGEAILLWEPHARADFTFVLDIVDGLKRALLSEDAANQTFNITFGESRTNQDLAAIVAAAIPGAEVERTQENDPQRQPKRGTMDITKAKRLLGFQPKYSLETAMPIVVRQYQDQHLF